MSTELLLIEAGLLSGRALVERIVGQDCWGLLTGDPRIRGSRMDVICEVASMISGYLVG